MGCLVPTKLLLLLVTLLIWDGVESKPNGSHVQQQKVKLKVKVRVSPGPGTVTRMIAPSPVKQYLHNSLPATSWGTSPGMSPASAEKLYILRRKKKGSKSKNGVSSESSSAQQQSLETQDVANANWVMSLREAVTSAKSNLYSSSPKKQTPIMVDTGPTSKFRSNIPLPRNPWIPTPAPQQTYSSKHWTGPSSTHYSPQIRPVSPHAHSSPPSSRADTFLNSLTSLTSSLTSSLPSTLGKWAKNALSASTHYSKPPPTDQIASFSAPVPASTTTISPLVLASQRNRASIDSLLTKLHRVEEIKASLPPRGSYTPYGERTIIMMKFPGLPARKRLISPTSSSSSSLGVAAVKPVSILVDDWNTPSKTPVPLKPSDVGVIIAQNYILAPDVSMNSHYNFDRTPSDGDSSSSAPSTDMVSLLAKALAERNRLINTYARKAAAGGMSSAPAPEPPFVLVHLETFTKKRNASTPFGFVEEVESSYANGTVIYPTLEDPGILASTRFEFEGLADIEAIFERPLAGEKPGEGMRPIVPLGLSEIQNYLRLMFSVHKDIHEGGRAKVGALSGLAHTLERTPLPEGRPLEEWEVQERMGDRWRQNWLHTSTLGLRSISDYPPPPPKLPVPYPTR